MVKINGVAFLSKITFYHIAILVCYYHLARKEVSKNIIY